MPPMRALLVVNHKATTTSGRVRDVLVQALRSEADLDVAYTQRRGHAASLAQRAAKDGIDVVVALGGDGTVNEVVNGLLTERARATGTGPCRGPRRLHQRLRPGDRPAQRLGRGHRRAAGGAA